MRKSRSRAARANLVHEGALLADGATVVVGMDEVGRGALAGPVTVGACAVGPTTGPCPDGLTDSKMLTARAREEYVPLIGGWSMAYAVGSAGPDEIDALGIIRALRLAGQRALVELARSVPTVDVVLLDGSHDWLTEPEPDLFDLLDEPSVRPPVGYVEPRVRTRVKADLSCASVAAASVVAKCERDAVMARLALEHPVYGWESNKGYGSSSHVDALGAHGPSPVHRVSWRLPGLDSEVLVGADGP